MPARIIPQNQLLYAFHNIFLTLKTFSVSNTLYPTTLGNISLTLNIASPPNMSYLTTLAVILASIIPWNQLLYISHNIHLIPKTSFYLNTPYSTTLSNVFLTLETIFPPNMSYLTILVVILARVVFLDQLAYTPHNVFLTLKTFSSLNTSYSITLAITSIRITS